MRRGPDIQGRAGEIQLGKRQVNSRLIARSCSAAALAWPPPNPLAEGAWAGEGGAGHFEGSLAHRPHQVHFRLTGAPLYVPLQAAHVCSPTYTWEAASTSISHKRILCPTAAVHPGSQKPTRRTELGLSQQPRVIKEPRPACSSLGESGGPLPTFAVSSFRSGEMPASGFSPFFLSLKYG